jgi:hypothetical protein
MNIPPLDVSVTKASLNGHIVDVVSYEEYSSNVDAYKNRTDVAIPYNVKGKDILLPFKGEYTPNVSLPGVYNAGCINFVIKPEEEFIDKYVTTDFITMNNTDDIKELIKKEDAARKLDEPFITSPDSITYIHIKDTDQPEMKGLKMALNAKNIDIDKYAARFGDNYPNDKRQLKNSTATLKIIKRFCENCDMEAVLVFKDKNPDVPNPMNKEISISLTDYNSDDNYYDENINEDIDSSEYTDE